MNVTRIISRISSLFLSLLFITVSPAQIRLAAVGGIHAASFPETNSIPGFDTAQGKYLSSRTGFQLGVLAEIPIGRKNLFFQPGINYSAKGNQYERFYDTSLVQTDTLYNQYTLKLNYIEIPLYLTYKFPISKNLRNHFFLSAGPYIAFIYTASEPYQNRVKYYNNDQYSFNSGTRDLDVGNGSGKYKTLDLGINAKAGFELGNVMLSAYFSRGLTNAYQAGYPSAFHHQLIGASLGIWLTQTKPAPPDNTDSDLDGTPDRDDSCKTIAGLPRYHGCPIPDTDGDGVNDEADSCKTVAGTARYHGCPIPDSDGDGVNDEEDSCKSTAGLPRYHGCPIPDTDGDGVNDEADSCKTTAGTAKYHGCPIPDTDGDGVNDEADQCPEQPGTMENRGCPVIKPAIVNQVNYAARKIQFRINSSRLTGNSLPALRDLADTLKANPDLELTIEGHTDNTGTPEYNQQLSQRRALEVKKALLKLGITEDRISVEGYGDTQPVGDNKTSRGRSINRRVVLKLHVKNS